MSEPNNPPSSLRAHPNAARPHVQVELNVPARLLLAAQCGLPYLPDKIRQKIVPLLSYETMTVIAGSIAVLIAAHAVGAGFAVDLVLGIATVAVIGGETIEAAKRLQTFYELALAAKYKADFDKAGREFATFVTIIGVNVALVTLTRVKVGTLPKVTPIDSNTLSIAWAAYIERITFSIPRDQGMLWTKITPRGAGRLAATKGLMTLDMLLKREGFYELYSRQFGSYQNDVTAEIWRAVSRRYVAQLEGKVTAYVSQRELASAISKSTEPVLVDEMWEIADAMKANSKITSVQMIDVSTGKTWSMPRAQVLKAGALVH